MSDPITLPENGLEALIAIASYLEAAYMRGKGRDIWANNSGKMFGSEVKGSELMGVWQTPEYTEGLHEIAAECRRLLKLALAPPDFPPLHHPPPAAVAPRRILRFQNVELPIPDPLGTGKAGSIPTLIAFADDGTCWAVIANNIGCGYMPFPSLPPTP